MDEAAEILQEVAVVRPSWSTFLSLMSVHQAQMAAGQLHVAARLFQGSALQEESLQPCRLVWVCRDSPRRCCQRRTSQNKAHGLQPRILHAHAALLVCNEQDRKANPRRGCPYILESPSGAQQPLQARRAGHPQSAHCCPQLGMCCTHHLSFMGACADVGAPLFRRPLARWPRRRRSSTSWSRSVCASIARTTSGEPLHPSKAHYRGLHPAS